MMFIPIESPSGTTVRVTFDGSDLVVPEGSSVAAAMTGYAGYKDCRCSFVSGEPRAPYCFIGVCHECLVEIDGKPNQQACITTVRDGMKIKKQQIREGT